MSEYYLEEVHDVYLLRIHRSRGDNELEISAS